MLQLVYISLARPESWPIDLDLLLRQASENNERDEVTGVLYTDGSRFLQALEGPRTTVEDTFLRIVGDLRHHQLRLLSRREVTRREFGEWSMVSRPFASAGDRLIDRMTELAGNSELLTDFRLPAWIAGSCETPAAAVGDDIEAATSNKREA